MKTGDVVINTKHNNSKKYLIINIDEIFRVAQMIDNRGMLREDIVENYEVIDNIDLSKLF